MPKLQGVADGSRYKERRPQAYLFLMAQEFLDIASEVRTRSAW